MVKDSGIGMSNDQLEKLFESFVRFRNEQTARIEGSGLGLSILKKICSLYNAEIDVKSKPEEGTTFTVIFPLSAKK